MHFYFLFLFLCLNFICASAFFLWKLKKEPLFFCYKICPLYCSKNKRSDVDYSTSSFIEDEWPGPPGPPAYWEEPDDHSSHSHGHIFPPHDHPHKPHEYEIVKHVKFIYHPYPPTTTTTTKKPESTPEPSGICIACMKKCSDLQLEHPWF